MLGKIVPQIEEEVKRDAEECSVEWCHEYVFRDGLCLDHFVAGETAAWDDHTDEVTQAHAVSVGRG